MYLVPHVHNVRDKNLIKPLSILIIKSLSEKVSSFLTSIL